jgi:hypothetical protein
MSTPTPHPHADLQIEYKRQEVMGELAAGWWEWQQTDKKGQLVACMFGPGWFTDVKYRCIKTPNHPQYDRHAATRAEWEKVKDKGTHELWTRDETSIASGEEWHLARMPRWLNSHYEIREIKPKKRLIDWSKVPRGVMTNAGELLGIAKDCVNAQILQRDAANWHEMLHVHPLTLRLAPAAEQPWIVLNDQAETSQIRWDALLSQRLGHIQVVRVIGLAEGYTDNQSEAE